MSGPARRIARITLGSAALVLAAHAANAVSLGKIEVRSRLGEPLEARIPLTVEGSEALRGACFSLLADPQGPLAGGAGRLELRHHAHGADLYLRTGAAMNQAAVAFAIAVGCPGAQRADPLRYSIALSSVATPAPEARTAASARGFPVVARLAVRSGDTLASLAHAIFPGDAAVQARYIAAMRAGNEALAAIGDDQPLAEGTAVALPDLHAFAATIPASHAAPRSALPPAAAKRAPPAETPTALAEARAPAPKPVPARKVAEVPPKAVAAREAPVGASSGFRLRLSAPVMDLSPSRGMDARRRAQLREQLLVLEADDRTAAMLEMRENIRRLESQVSALKLKLATLEAAPVARPEPRAATPPAAAPKVEPSAPAVEPSAPAVEPPARKVEATAPKTEPPTAKTEPPKVAAAPSPQAAPAPQAEPAPLPKPKPAPAAKAAPAAPAQPWYLDRMWMAALAAIFVIAWLVLRIRVRMSEEPEEAAPEAYAQETSAMPDTGSPPTTEPHELSATDEPEIATRVPAEDNAELRRRYMEERFPEIVNGALVLEDERSVVKAARLLYEDDTAPRAVELLQFAIEQDPDGMAPWLALFEIFRREQLTGEFAQLAARFHERHGATDEWRKVRSIGRALDPGNALYEGPEYGAPVDPEAEGWLRSPSDDAGRALAGELRAKLMSQAGVAEGDLHADPTPALRKAEMFNLA